MDTINKTVYLSSLEAEIKAFVDGLPYWAKFLCAKIISGSTITNEEIDLVHSFLLEELELIEETDKQDILLDINPESSINHKDNLTFTSLQNVEGVNALTENQSIEFSSNLTIIYGSNGSGKSGYIRLFKKVFYSIHKEDILQNIYKPDGHKLVSAEFYFKSAKSDIPLKYPADSANGIFNQFAVFDGKVALKHLENRNDFTFRPSGLSLFSDFNTALEMLQTKHDTEIALRSIDNPYAEIFEGESDISIFINLLSSNSDLEKLKKHFPFTEKDRAEKQRIDKEYDDLLIALNFKEKEIKALQDIKTYCAKTQTNLSSINLYFAQDYLNSVHDAITNCIDKQIIAKREGIENFSTNKISNVGSSEWKEFIEAAEKFALGQKSEDSIYPEIGDNCLFCHQPILKEQQDLITSYWTFIKSVAEQETKVVQNVIDKIRDGFQELSFDQFPEENRFTIWLKENYPDILKSLNAVLSNQRTLSEQIISDIFSKTANQYSAIQIDLNYLESINNIIDSRISLLQEDEKSTGLADLLKLKKYLAHKEKLDQRFTDIELLHQKMIWVSKANDFNKQTWKTISTKTEKRLSKKYFNEKYVEAFNNECNYLNGNFGIEIDARSSEGQSNRQLLLKGNTPSAILSEGEQKVIAIADFLAESKLSIINKGIIFDDPVNSLDEERKSNIAERLVKESLNKQVIIFTHDLVFLNSLYNYSEDFKQNKISHWIERINDEIGVVALNNSPSLEADYKKSSEAQFCRDEAKKQQGQERERSIKHGFTALRTSYEALIIFKILNGAIERFNERVSIDRLKNMVLDKYIIDEVIKSYDLCCRYMEGHLHSNRYAAKKPTLEGLIEEINRFDALNSKIGAFKKKIK